jgi:hypothetical protein
MVEDILAKRRQQRKLLALIGGLVGATIAMSAAGLGKNPYHTSSLTGLGWLTELYNGNANRFKEQLGMNKHVFSRLVQDLKRKTSLHDTRWVTAEEQVAIFCYTVVTNLPNRKVAERFQRSGDTISR